MSDLVIDDHPRADRAPGPAEPHLGWALAGLSAGAAVIHFAMVPVHAGGSLLDPLGFAVVGWLQLAVAAAVISGRAGTRTYQLAVLVNAAAVGLWVWSRTVGLPVGSHEGIVEEVGAIDLASAALEVGVVLLAVRLLLAPERRSVSRLAPALAAVAALGLVTTVITSPDAADHGSAGATAAAPVSEREATIRRIERDRCDEDLNIPAYYEEAAYLGIDTYLGGALPAASSAAAPAASDGHGHQHGGAAPAAATASTTTTEPDPTDGRGSPVLDGLVAATSLSSQGEGAAARLVAELSEASEADYDAWLWWLRSSGSLSHEHAPATASGDTGGHGGHVGPQPWTALTDPAQCEALRAEVAEAREVALRYPTAADATAAGWRRVTGFVGGIAAHYMNFGLVDGEFRVDEPEMILYDGDGPDARVVGLSYYLIQDGESEPTQGFTGANDHGHRHIGLCTGPGGVIGDSTTTAEECASRGGIKADGSKGWMSHAWVVPGCESPWGLFSAASPVLDYRLSGESGRNEGGCSASAVRERYGLDDLPDARAVVASAADGASDEDETASGD